MVSSMQPINYRPARFSTKAAAHAAARELAHTQLIYIGWLAAKYWGVPGRGWYLLTSDTLGGRLATEEEIQVGYVTRSGAWATVATVVGLLFTAYPTHATEVWLGGLDPVERRVKTPEIRSDFLDLFRPNAPWRTAASKIRAFGVSTQFIMQGSDADLVATFSGLKSRGIALYVEVGFLYGAGRCGTGMEGYSAHNTARALATRIKKLGGELTYAAMDEPLWFGRHARKPTSCNWEIPQIMSEVAEGVSQLRQVFPDVMVGDTEPVGGHDFDWPDEIRTWASSFKAAAGTPLAFLHTDIQWRLAWQQELKVVAHNARADGILFGPIVDSDRDDQSDIDWMNHTLANLRKIQEVLGSMPDQLVMASWQRAPSRFLPETEPGTLTNLVVRTQR